MNRIRKQGHCAFFVFPDGESISIEDTERVLMRILEVRSDEMDIAGALWGLAQDCFVQACNEAGVSYIRTAMQFSRDGAETAKRCLFLGLLMEQRENYKAAAAAYSEALQLTPSRDDTWYSIYNNLGYSLSRCGRHREAESYCRAAFDMDPRAPQCREKPRPRASGAGPIGRCGQGVPAGRQPLPRRPARLCPSGGPPVQSRGACRRYSRNRRPRGEGQGAGHEQG